MLPIILWFTAAWIALGVIVRVTQVGKRREPITGGTAAITVIAGALIVTGQVWAALTV